MPIDGFVFEIIEALAEPAFFSLFRTFAQLTRKNSDGEHSKMLSTVHCSDQPNTHGNMTSNIVYEGNLRTRATHLRSGQEIITDAPIDNQGKGEAFSPTDLVATALGSCMLTIMGIKARDNDIDITGTSCSVNKIMGSEPRRISKVELEIRLPNKAYTAAQRALLEEAARGCPVCKSLSQELQVDLKFIWPM